MSILHEIYKYYALKVELQLKLRGQIETVCTGMVTQENGIKHFPGK